jgi:hypothetical protein
MARRPRTLRLGANDPADVAAAARNPAPEIIQSREGLLEGRQAIGVPPSMEWVATVYSHADSLAIRFSGQRLLAGTLSSSW